MISPEVLRRYPYFVGVSEESLKAVAMLADARSVPAGTQLFSEGDTASMLNIIVRGKVEIQYTLGSGERRTVDTLVDGDILGWSALVEPHKYTAIGMAKTDLELVSIQAKKLRDLCDRDPTMGYRLTTQIAKLLAHRLEGARIQLAVS
jgi:CRP-like cAMP-binding protein